MTTLLASRPGIASHPSIPPLDLEDPEVSELDPTFLNERFDQRIERFLDPLLGTELGQVELFGDRPDDVFLGHGSDAPTAFPTDLPSG